MKTSTRSMILRFKNAHHWAQATSAGFALYNVSYMYNRALQHMNMINDGQESTRFKNRYYHIMNGCLMIAESYANNLESMLV